METSRAIDLIARCAPELPFWPQLRRISPREAIVPQFLGPSFKHAVGVRGEYSYHIPADRIDRFTASLAREDAKLESANAAGFYAFLDAYGRGAFPHARAAKGQTLGPITASCALETEDGPLLLNHELRELITDYAVRMANWQADALLRVAPSVVLVLDEAYLGVVLRTRPELRGDVVALLRAVVVRIRRPGVLVGLHCCDELPFAVVAEIAPDVLSFDAHHGGAAFADDADARRFVAEGGHVAWGWVPTRDDLSGVNAAAVVDRWVGVAKRMAEAGDNIDLPRIRCRSLVTASCGLAGSSEATSERSFALAKEISQRFGDACESAS